MKIWFITLAIYAAIVFGISWIPLVGAYDYEAALGVALIGLIAVPCLAPRRPRQSMLSLVKTLGSALCYWITANLMTLAVAGIRSELCDFVQGLEYQLLISLPAVLLAALVWGWISRICRFRFVHVIVYLLALAADFGIALYALYHWPPLVAFGQFFGFFAGSIYDEAIQVIPTLIYWRLGTAVLCACLLFAQTPGAGVARKFALPVLGICCALGYHIWLAETEVITPMGRSSLAQTLWQTVQPEDGSFRVHYVPKSKSRRALNEENYRVLSEFSRDYRMLESFFRTRPAENIDIWLYPTRELKGKFIGAKNTSFARVWKNEIHLVETSPDSTLARHEMAHLFAGAFGHRPLRLAGGWHIPALGWIEGLAMAAEWPVQTYNLHVWSAAILDNPSMVSDIGPHELLYGFWGLPSRIAYTLAGSWVRWLIDHYGIEKIKLLSREMPGAFEDIIGISFTDAFDAWKHDLRTKYRNPTASKLAPVVYSSTSIWNRHCARQQAALNAAWYQCLEDEYCELSNLSPSLSRCDSSDDRASEPTIQDLEKIYQYYVLRGPLDEEQIVPLAIQLLAESHINIFQPSIEQIWRSMTPVRLDNTELSSFDTYSASDLRTIMFDIYDQIDKTVLPEAARVLWLERQADMMWHAQFYAVAEVMFDALGRRPLPESMQRRIEIKHQAAKYPQSPVSQAVRIWMNSGDAVEHARIAERFPNAPVIVYLDFIRAIHQRDYEQAHRALVRIFMTVAEQDPATRLGVRQWRELMRLLPYI